MNNDLIKHKKFESLQIDFKQIRNDIAKLIVFVKIKALKILSNSRLTHYIKFLSDEQLTRKNIENIYQHMLFNNHSFAMIYHLSYLLTISRTLRKIDIDLALYWRDVFDIYDERVEDFLLIAYLHSRKINFSKLLNKYTDLNVTQASIVRLLQHHKNFKTSLFLTINELNLKIMRTKNWIYEILSIWET